MFRDYCRASLGVIVPCLKSSLELDEFVSYGMDVDAKDGSGNTALHYAIVSCPEDVVESMIVKSSSLSRYNASHTTPLHLSITSDRSIRITRMLISRGADVRRRDASGSTPLHAAASADMSDLFFRAVADVDESGDGLQYMSSSKARVVAYLLSRAGADVDAQNGDGDTALNVAIDKGSVDVVDAMLKLGAKTCLANKFGNTALHLCAMRSEIRIASMLMEGGADAAAKNALGETPIDIAMKMGAKELVRVLSKRRAPAEQDDAATAVVTERDGRSKRQRIRD
jgi:hypothetical protein